LKEEIRGEQASSNGKEGQFMSTANRVDPDQQNEDAYEELIVSIEAGEGTLSLLLAVCDDSRLRDEIISRYEAELAPDIRHYHLPILRGEPSLTQTIRNKVQEDEYLRNGGRAVVTITGAEQLFFLKLGEERSEQEIFFGYLQWTREALRDFHFPIVLWVTHQLLAQLARHAPDFWSWRKGVFRFTSKKTGAVRSSEIEAIRPVLEGFDLPTDDDYLLPLEDLKALIAQTEARQPKDPLLATLYSQMGEVYFNRLKRGEAQDYQQEAAQAVDYFRRAADLQTQLGQETDLANSLNWLGRLYDNQGRYSEAELLYVQALEMRKRLLGEDHSDVANSLNNLALLYRTQGRYSEAEPLSLQALEMDKHLVGEEHPDVAIGLNNLASLYQSQGRISEAEPLYVQALEMRKRLLSDAHPDVAQSLNNLAVLYTSQGRYSEAEPLHMQALATRKRLLGEEHPDVATDLNNLAMLYTSQGRYSEAELFYVQALDMDKRLLGEDHPVVATRLNNLAYLYTLQGRYSEAELFYVQALEMSKHLMGEDHPNVATNLNNLAKLYTSQEQYSEAEPLYVQALDIVERQLGATHPSTVRIRENLEGLRSIMQQ
jgi:tetratricopeptide (TPR) repeat protein